MAERVLITGGTGLIGRVLAAGLAGDGYEVVVLSRSPERAGGMPAGVRVERWDARTPQGWGALADGAWAVVNLAGEGIAAGRWTAERKRRIRDSRIDAGRAVVEAIAAARNKPAVVVQASGVGYYGPCGEHEVAEDAPPGQDYLARLAVEWEAATAAVESMGVRRALVRTGIVLASNGGALPRMMLPFRLFVGGRLGSGRQWLPWIHLADEVGALRFLMENEKARGPFNLAAPRPVTNADFARRLGRRMGRPAVVPAPGWLLRVALGEMGDMLLAGQKAVPRRLTQMGYGFRFAEVGAALEDLRR
jgi:uncharacterized protein (TIGR01777 family)